MKELLKLGSWERFFPASPRGVFVSSFGRLVCSVAEWVPHSVVFASGVDFVCVLLALLLLALLPLALPWGLVCFGGLAVILFTWAFSCVGLPRMRGLLAALPEVRLPGMGCWCTFRVPQILCLPPLPGVRSWLLVSGIAVRALLLATSLPVGMDVSAPGRCLSVSTFYGLFSILKVLVLKCRVLPFS